MSNFQKAALIAEIATGNGKAVTVGGKVVAVFNVNGAFHAIDNTCVHRGGPLGDGTVDGTVVACPFHGWQYDVTTGACLTNPAAKVATYPVKVDGPDLLIDLG